MRYGRRETWRRPAAYCTRCQEQLTPADKIFRDPDVEFGFAHVDCIVPPAGDRELLLV
jgi:hypothetical protein